MFVLIFNQPSDEIFNLPHNYFYAYNSVFIMPTELQLVARLIDLEDLNTETYAS
jgi:hypothetical protein